MFKVKVYHRTPDGKEWWEELKETFATYEGAEAFCMKKSLEEVSKLMVEVNDIPDGEITVYGDYMAWFETDHFGYEVLDEEELTDVMCQFEDSPWFDVATLVDDYAPWERENHSDCRLVTGYCIEDYRYEFDNGMIKKMEVSYVYNHHMNHELWHCMSEVDAMIENHDWESFKKWLEWEKKQDMEYFPKTITVRFDREWEGEIELNEHNFKTITFVEHECG